MKEIPTFLWVLLVVYCGASLLHFAHNAEFLADYPNLPDWLTRSRVYLAWIVVTAVGILGTVLIKLGSHHFGLAIIAGYATLGFAGLDHYWVAPLASHSIVMNATIWLEVAAAAILLVASLVLLLRSVRWKV